MACDCDLPLPECTRITYCVLPSMQGIVEQVAEDHKLLQERILKLTGPAGVSRMDDALGQIRADYEAMRQQEEANKEAAANMQDLRASPDSKQDGESHLK